MKCDHCKHDYRGTEGYLFKYRGKIKAHACSLYCLFKIIEDKLENDIPERWKDATF